MGSTQQQLHTQWGFQRFCKFSSRRQVLYRLIQTQTRNPALHVAAERYRQT